jgi:hypothetical protein
VNFTSLDGASFALNSSGFKSLTLLNGWQDYGSGVAKAEVKNINGIVHFKGAIAGGSNDEPFVLPSGFRPAKLVYVPVDLINGTNGRLVIYPDGLVYIEAEDGSLSNAQGFTSLDGAWFVAKDSGFDKLSLTNGWTDYESGTGQAKAKIVNGIVYFQGAISTSGNSVYAFVLPSSMTPPTNVYVPIDLCNATKGRLDISPDGSVEVQAETSFNNAKCFTSLEGASFVK